MNILELNTKLYELYDKVEKGEIDEKKAQAMIDVSNTIINNTKVIISVAKAAKSQNALNAVIGDPGKMIETAENVESETEQLKEGSYEAKSKFAKRLGYDSLADAVSKMGTHEFNTAFQRQGKIF